eukprot:2842104-Alexandrium_andersonii.AAC.1
MTSASRSDADAGTSEVLGPNTEVLEFSGLRDTPRTSSGPRPQRGGALSQTEATTVPRSRARTSVCSGGSRTAQPSGPSASLDLQGGLRFAPGADSNPMEGSEEPCVGFLAGAEAASA